MKILVFDNYDSFTYNLVHLVEKIQHAKVDVFSNDAISLEEIRVYDKIILSPGPGLPRESNLLLPLIREYASSKSILGVCLGHQAIGEAFGATLENLETVYHGVATPLTVIQPGNALFRNFGFSEMVGRYHSWVISRQNFPADLEVTATDPNNLVMAIAHKTFDISGVQFHPESILTPSGGKLMQNWLDR